MKLEGLAVCSQPCGQMGIFGRFRKMRKTRKCPCVKGFGRVGSDLSDERCRTPKPGAIPTSLYPDIQFLPLYHGSLENQRVFCLWSFLWSKPLLCRFRQSCRVPQTQVSQGFAAFRLALFWIPPRTPKPRALPSELHPVMYADPGIAMGLAALTIIAEKRRKCKSSGACIFRGFVVCFL